MSKGTGTKWLLGCGIGCGLVVVLVVAAAVMVGVAVRRAVEPLITAGKSQETLVEQLGAPETFVPPLDGAVPAERMELFLDVRDELSGPRARIEAWFAEFSVDEIKDEDSMLRTLRNAVGKIGEIVGPIGEYLQLRNRMLLDRGMSLGEYLYVYGTAYYSFLGHDPGDGPAIADAGEDKRVLGDSDSTFSPEKVRERYRRVTTFMLRNLARESAGAGGAGGWSEDLEQEALRIESSPGAVAWREGGLPAAVAASLEPFRDRLEATWSAAVNPFEMPLGDREWSNVKVEMD